MSRSITLALVMLGLSSAFVPTRATRMPRASPQPARAPRALRPAAAGASAAAAGDAAPAWLAPAYSAAGLASAASWLAVSYVALSSHPVASVDAACGLRHNALTGAQALCFPLCALLSLIHI